MSQKNSVKTNWDNLEKQAKDEIKFLPKNDCVSIYPMPEPYVQEIDGKFGKQLMYIVATNIGVVALNRTQFLKVAAAFSSQSAPYSTPIRMSR